MSTTLLSPSAVLDAADSFDVDLTTEPYLLWILREYVCTPLPPTYSQAINEIGQEGFVNDVTGRGSVDHPATKFFNELIRKERATHNYNNGLSSSNNKDDKAAADTQPGDGGNGSRAAESSSSHGLVVPSSAVSRPSVRGGAGAAAGNRVPVGTDPSSVWMEFPSGVSSSYYHNFSLNKSVTVLPSSRPGYPPPVVLSSPAASLRALVSNVVLSKLALDEAGGSLLPLPGLQVPVPSSIRRRSGLLPDLMRFKSWWMEADSIEGGTKRRTVELVFDTKVGELTLKFDGGASETTTTAATAAANDTTTGKAPSTGPPPATSSSSSVPPTPFPSSSAGPPTFESPPPGVTVSYKVPLPPSGLRPLDLYVGTVLVIFGRPTTLMQANLQTQQWYTSEHKRLCVLRRTLATELGKYDISQRRELQKDKESEGTGQRDRSLAGIAERCEELATRLYAIRPSAASRIIE